jgi:hypothetical protein
MPAPHWTEAIRPAGPNAVSIELHVEPGSAYPGLEGFDIWRHRLVLRVRAPPQDGQANREVVEVLAELLGVSTSSVSIIAGATSRRKVVRIDGITVEAARAALAPHMEKHEAPAPEGVRE